MGLQVLWRSAAIRFGQSLIDAKPKLGAAALSFPFPCELLS